MRPVRQNKSVLFQGFDEHMQAMERDDYEALTEEFNDIPLPPFHLTEDDARSQANRAKNRHVA